MPDLYEILDVPQDAAPETIQRAYRQVGLEYERARGSASEELEERYQAATRAYRVLSSPEKRAAYDRQRELARARSGPRQDAGGSPEPLEARPAPAGAVAPRGDRVQDIPPRGYVADDVVRRGDVVHDVAPRSDRDGGVAAGTGAAADVARRPARVDDVAAGAGEAGAVEADAVDAAGDDFVLLVPPAATPGAGRRTAGKVVVAAGAILAVVAAVGGGRLLGGILLAAAILLVSLLLSVVEPWLAPALGAGRDRLRGFRTGALARASARHAARLRAFLEARATEPQRSLLAVLDRLARAVEGAGERDARALDQLRRRLAEDVSGIGRLGRLVEEREALTSKVGRGAGVSGVSALGLFAVVMGLMAGLVLVNTWFVGDVAAAAAAAAAAGAADGVAASAWPAPGPILPLSLSICAVATGMVLYGLRSMGSRSADRALVIGPYLLLLVLAALQGTAYAPAADRLDLAAWLGVDSGHALYPVLRNGIAFAGAVGPLALAALGYAAWMCLDRFFTAVSKRAAARGLDRNTRSLISIHRQLEAAAERMELLRGHAGTGAGDAARGLAAALGAAGGSATALAGSGGSDTALGVVRRAAAELQRSGRAGSDAPERKTAGQVVAGLLANTLLLAIWCLAVIVFYGQLSARIAGHGILGPGAAELAAGCLAVALGLAGFLAKDALWGSAHLALWSSAAPAGRGRKAVAVLALAVLAAGAAAGVWAFATGPAVGTTAAVNAFFGVLLVLAIVISSLNLDAVLVAVAHAFVAVAHALPWLACAAARTVTALLEGSFAAARPALKLAALPAKWLRFGAATPPAGAVHGGELAKGRG